MSISLEKNSFLHEHGISTKDWEDSQCDWDVLLKIANDHENNIDSLKKGAEFPARVLQETQGVHSVRWRVKDTGHILEKIIRKKIEKSEKYEKINEDNYHEIITDLIGIRALHLFKDEFTSIDKVIREKFEMHEDPIAYIRSGDPDDFSRTLAEHKFEVKQHPAGYRSLHYVIHTTPARRKIYVEIQVRTIFEEGWSEIDHIIRYPNFSDDYLVIYFLKIFNRMAGSADEMGGFVKDLAQKLGDYQLEIHNTEREKNDVLEQLEVTLSNLENIKEQDTIAKDTIKKMKNEINALRALLAKEYSVKKAKGFRGMPLL